MTPEQQRKLDYYRRCHPNGAPVNLHDHEDERALQDMGLVHLASHPRGAIICTATDKAMQTAQAKMTLQELYDACQALRSIQTNQRAIEALSADYEGLGMPVVLDAEGREDAIRALLVQQRRFVQKLRELGVDVTDADFDQGG